MLNWRVLAIGLPFIVLACTANNGADVGKARDFKAFDVWWLGDEFEGFKLSRADETSFLYGTCKATSDGG